MPGGIKERLIQGGSLLCQSPPFPPHSFASVTPLLSLTGSIEPLIPGVQPFLAKVAPSLGLGTAKW